VRFVFRASLTCVLAALVAVPVADAAGPTATTAAPTIQTAPQPAPGSAFGPLSPQVGEPAQTQPTVTATKRADDTGNGRGTLLFLSLVALVMIVGVAGFIWYEGRKTGSAAKRRRRRMRSGRTPQPATAGSGARRGPPPPPRKRRAQAAKRKKR
jgi:hypothetical protein